MYFADQDDTPAGIGALGVIRVSGSKAFDAFSGLFSKDLASAKPHTVHYGQISEAGEIIDEVVATVFRGPRSFTGEDTVEISCHGSDYIQTRILKALLSAGCRMAEPGEFSMRAFANGKVDLSQAEG
ncbi:MAG: tRNA uridine-5-carboxymethylaminomethyl(34) synthesis GTPase MnmE, partial [Cryomorphaceae bacterium]